MQISNKKSMFALFSLLLLAGASEAKKQVDPLETLSKEAYIWGYPAVMMKHTRESMLEQTGHPTKSLNQFFHSEKNSESALKNLLLPSSDNISSWAWLDLEKEPLLLNQPAIAERFFSIQFVDAFTNVFHVISNQNFGEKASVFALTSPTWKGELPAGVIRIRATTNEVFLFAQTGVKGSSDLSEAVKINRQLQLVPLSSWQQGLRKVVAPSVTPKGSAQIQSNFATLGVRFFKELSEITRKNPPPTSADLQQWQKYSKDFTKNFDSPTEASAKAAIERGLFSGARAIDDRAAKGFGPKVNGWSYELRVEPFREDYLARAAVAQSNLFSVPAKEMIHLKTTSDSEERQLYGNYKYTLHFAKGQLPPTRATWTLKLYEAHGKSRASATEKAAIHQQSDSLKFNDDGSLDIHLQVEAPEKTAQKNWLPLTSESSFFVVLTIYNPQASVLNRKFTPPTLSRIEEEEGLPKPRIVRTMMARTMSQNETLR